MRLLTWNLNGRRKVEDQVAAIAARSPDIVALQELILNSATSWREVLPKAGLAHVIDSFASSPTWEAKGPRKYGLVLAGRFPLTVVTSAHVVPWPERILSATVETPRGAINVSTTHIPPGCTNGWMKVKMLNAVCAIVSERSDTRSILCGDFNVPQAETLQGRIITWGEDIIDGEPKLWGRFRGGDAREWDAAERTMMEGGAHRQLIDAYRHLHGYDRQEFSWFVKRKERRIGRRFDHIFCSRGLRITGCEYLHSLREAGLSDHSGLELDFEIEAGF
jgi:exonuclease III